MPGDRVHLGWPIPAVRGRGAALNPGNRFGSLTLHVLGPELAKLSPAAIWSGFPEAFESDPGNPRVVNGVFRVTMAEVVLDEPEVVALVRQVEAA